MFFAWHLKPMSEDKPWKNFGEDCGNGYLLQEIEKISKALYLQKPLPRALNSLSYCPSDEAAKTMALKTKPKVLDSSQKDKKSSIWKRKLFKALTHFGNRRFNCCFSLHVHVIEGLPSHFDHLRLCVTWRLKKDQLTTRPALVSQGMAEFEEPLMHHFTTYGSRHGPEKSVEYKPRHSLLQVSVIGAPGRDIGKHWIDLTRLLPLTFEELDKEKRCSGKWTTRYNLTGRAKGAILNVSFEFFILEDSSYEPGCYVRVPSVVRERRSIATSHLDDFDGNVRRNSSRGSHRHSLSLDPQFLEEISADWELPKSDNRSYHTPDEGFRDNSENEVLKCGPSSLSDDRSTVNMFGDAELTVTEQGVEVCLENGENKEEYVCEKIDGSVIEIIDFADILEGDGVIYDSEYKESNNIMITKEETREELDSLPDITEHDELENDKSLESSFRGGKLIKSHSFDDLAESIASDFLDMLSVEENSDDDFSDCGAESLKDCLLGEFEENNLIWRNSIFDVGVMTEHKPSCFSASLCSDDYGLSFAFQEGEGNHNAKMLENLETEALMREWGLDEKAFQNSPCNVSGGFGSPVYIPSEEPLKLTSLGEGIGPVIQTKDGGFLRSMNPLLFRNCKNGARLVMQLSAPVLLPEPMGLSIMDILKCWASAGVEKMFSQVNKLMPLEDITGKTIQELVSEAESRSDMFKRWNLQVEKLHSCSNCQEIESDYVCYENLVPSAMTIIEALLIEGLKIQSNMPDQEAPSTIRVQRVNSMALQEWLKLDASDFDNGNKINESGSLGRNEESCGVSGKNFTMGLNVQLRNPLRYYETVGSSMLALIQVERVHSEQWGQGRVIFDQNQKEIQENHVPMFKILDVHLAGLKVEHGDEQPWGTRRQVHSGSRWLFSSGMSTTNKLSTSNSTVIAKSSAHLTRMSCPEDVLWSIPSDIQGEAATWDDTLALNIHVRNPDIIFSNEVV